MKHLFSIIFILMAALGSSAADTQKSAFLMVHFGTTYPDTRQLTIEAINNKVREAFPGMRVDEAFTSRIVIKRLKERGDTVPTPREALLRLAADGYTHVFVQSTNIIDGIEAAALREEVEYMAPFFEDIRIGRPLLYSVADCEAVVGILTGEYPKEKGKSYLFVGHGTHTSANAIYSQIDYMMNAAGRRDCMVCTVEGYPTLDLCIRALKRDKARSVTLVPMMFVAGDHARNDIATDMRGELESDGFSADAVLTGLGQMPAIQDMFIEHIRQGMKEKPLSASEHKRQYLLK